MKFSEKTINKQSKQAKMIFDIFKFSVECAVDTETITLFGKKRIDFCHFWMSMRHQLSFELTN